MKILILFAHPAFHRSKVNKLLVDGLSNIEGVTFHDLYEEYPELDIDVKREQQLLLQHDIIVFQFPMFWYSTPAILKEWQDMVLEHGWAYGSKGDALKDKLFFCVITTGGPHQAYREGGFHNHTVNQLIAPLRQTAVLCKMKPLPSFVIHGTHVLEPAEILDYRKELLSLLKVMVGNEFDPDKANMSGYLNDYLTKDQG